MSNYFRGPILLHWQSLVCSENLRLGSHSSIDLVNQQPIIFDFLATANNICFLAEFMRQCEDTLVQYFISVYQL